jgi:ribosomal protein S6--L-glutamate ligase
MILSFHPHVRGDVNLRLSFKGLFTNGQTQAMASAHGVVVPQRIKPLQYAFCRDHCPNLFPDYTYRFGFEGKYANIHLFRRFTAPHPETVCYESVDDFKVRHDKNKESHLPFPFVLKGDEGGGGWAVFLVRDRHELRQGLKRLADVSVHATRRFIAQAFVPHQGRDLRVVVIGNIIKAYWRCQRDPGEFRNNVGRGAVIRHHLDPELTAKGIQCVSDFCSKTGINLAAFDVLFDRSRPQPEPLLSEINFVFGRKGLGGSERFRELLNEAVQEWTRGRSATTGRNGSLRRVHGRGQHNPSLSLD